MENQEEKGHTRSVKYVLHEFGVSVSFQDMYSVSTQLDSEDPETVENMETYCFALYKHLQTQCQAIEIRNVQGLFKVVHSSCNALCSNGCIVNTVEFGKTHRMYSNCWNFPNGQEHDVDLDMADILIGQFTSKLEEYIFRQKICAEFVNEKRTRSIEEIFPIPKKQKKSSIKRDYENDEEKGWITVQRSSKQGKRKGRKAKENRMLVNKEKQNHNTSV